MLLALAELLRCTEPHAESWLVARADVTANRRMVRGVLGCPVCGAEREVRAGVVWWTGAGAPAVPDPRADAASESLMRVGALLGYAEGPAPFVLCGDAALAANGLAGLAEAPLVLLDPPDDRAAPFATVVRGATRVPLGGRSVRGIVLDARWAADDHAASAVAALRQGGRLVGPAECPVPPGVTEIARDAAHWVAERTADVVTLARAPR